MPQDQYSDWTKELAEVLSRQLKAVAEDTIQEYLRKLDDDAATCLTLPFAWSPHGSDGFRGSPVHDPLTIYLCLPGIADDSEPAQETTLRDLIWSEFPLDHPADAAEAAPLLKELSAHLRALAQEIDERLESL